MRQIWVDVTRDFYTEFPEALERHFLIQCSSIGVSDEDRTYIPLVWKTIGDELVFCCTIRSVRHLATCVTSFMRALNEYGAKLETRNHPLDVKGCAWVATFPTDNVIVEVSTDRSTASKEESELPTEQAEERADNTPFKFDFLGKGIDTGFRLARFASAEQCAISLELAWLLTESELSNISPLTFSYLGREILKGVHHGKPYPVITIDTERNSKRRDVQSRERLLTGQRILEPLHLNDFLSTFMDAERIDQPFIPTVGPQPSTPPQSYRDYATSWDIAFNEVERRTASEQASNKEKDAASSKAIHKDAVENRETRNSSLNKLILDQSGRPVRIRLRPHIRPPAQR